MGKTEKTEKTEEEKLKEEREKLFKERMEKEVKLFSKRMVELRKTKAKEDGRKITPAIASDEIGIHVNALNNYEYDRFPQVEQLIKIKEYYKVPFDYLLGVSKLLNTDEKYQAVHEFTGLSDEAIENLKEIVTLDKEAMEECSNISVFRDVLDILNLLLENENKYHFFKNMASFLFFDSRHKELIENDEKIIDEKTGIECSISMLSKLAKFEIDETLYKLKKDIEKKAKENENNTKDNKKKK